jgi:MYXO-CTERM domain-containing protein
MLLLALALATGLAHADVISSGTPVCASKFDENCAALTPGGYTVITPFNGPNFTAVVQVLTGGTVTGYQVINALFTDASVQAAVVADEGALAVSPPACSISSTGNCYAPNPGGSVVVTNSTSSTFVNVDTPVTQRVDDYSTTLTAVLNGNQTVFNQTFALPFNDAAVQTALMQADAILAADKANAKAPVLTANSTILQGSQFGFVQTGEMADGNFNVTTTDTFGPATIDVGYNQNEFFFVLSGQLDINENTNFEFAIMRNAVTTNTFLTTQSYEIDGSTTQTNTPEAASWALMLVGLGAIWMWRRGASILADIFTECRQECRHGRLERPLHGLGGLGALGGFARRRRVTMYTKLSMGAVLCGLFLGGTASAGPITGLPACSSNPAPDCTQATPGGFTLLATLGDPYFLGCSGCSTETAVYGALTGGQVVFEQSIFAPYTDPSIAAAVALADTAVAKFAPYNPLQPCTGLGGDFCLAPNPGGAVVVTNSTSSSFVNVDTPVTQRIDDYSTTIKAVLNGNQTVFQQTYALAFGDPTVQAAVVAAQSILTADKASYGAPVLKSTATVLQGSQLSYIQTGEGADGNTLVTTTNTFGPAWVEVGDNQNDIFVVLAGQLDINVNTNIEYAIMRNAVTTNTYLTTQSYEIDGTSSVSSAPEPGTWTMILGGLCALGGLARRLR